jgi:hypothetical protein
MTMGTDSLGSATAVTPDRFAGQRGELMRHNGAVPDGPPRPTLADLDALAEPVFPNGWLDDPTRGAPGGLSLADHPLLRGLLLELPPKGAMPPAGWLDRWFEAARSILELLYVQDAQRR